MLKDLKVSVVNPVHAPLKKAKISEQADGGGKTLNIKSADCICTRRIDEKDFDQWWWETVYKGNVL